MEIAPFDEEVCYRDLERFAEAYYPNEDIDGVARLIQSDPGIDYRYFCFRYLDDIRKFELPKLEQNLKKEAVIVEFRSFPHLEFILRNAIRKLGNSWSFTIVCGNQNHDFLRQMIEGMGANIKLIKYDCDNIDQNSYSAMLSKKDFWEAVVGEKILIFQEDSCIFNSNVDEFIEWDYIGAPWALQQNSNRCLVGNGGLSLRTKSVMLGVINKVGILETEYNSSTTDFMRRRELTVPPEDVYFSKNIIDFDLGKVANWTVANRFSVETQYFQEPFGGHKFWLGIKEWKKHLYDKCLLS